MRNLWIVFVVMLLLSACAPATATPSVYPTVTNTAAPIAVSASLPECQVLEISPTPNPDEPSLFPKVGEDDHIRGGETAIVTIIEYADFQCPGCAVLASTLDQLTEAHPDQLRVVFRHFPLLPIHDKAALSTQAAEAAALQGKFWEMHDLLFQQQENWAALSPTGYEKWLFDQAEALALDFEQFKMDMSSQAVVSIAQTKFNDGLAISLPGTPFLLINGRIYTGPTDFNSLDSIIRLIALGERQFTNCPPPIIDTSKEYIATLHTEKGEIVIQLFPEKAPIAVNNFVFLARNGWYDNITFHRVIPGFAAQTGDPTGTGNGAPGYFFQNEIHPTLNFDRAGLVALANSGPNSNGSQFFITYDAAPHLNGDYTIFGVVLSGMEAAVQLTPRSVEPGQSAPPGDVLFTVSIEER